MLSRNTYLELDISNIEKNVYKIINTYNQYQYYFGVVKADCYGHGDINVVKAIVKGGCNYLAVATLDEAIAIRKEINDIPVLCLGYIESGFIEECKKQNITVTINSLEYLQEILKYDYKGLKVHLKINTGMNRLGVSDKKEVEQVIELLNKNNIVFEGIYTHIYNAGCKEDYNKQIEKFEELLSSVDISNVPIIHISASEALEKYKKPKIVNGCRLGIIMYGYTENKNIELSSTMQLVSEVIQINTLKKNDIVGYNGTYRAKEGEEKVAVIPIGYADGIIRKNKGRTVYINGREYEIVGNICMDMLFIKIDDMVKLHDKVYILKDIKHIKKVANHLETIPYEVMCSIGKRVTRVYK